MKTIRLARKNWFFNPKAILLVFSIVFLNNVVSQVPFEIKASWENKSLLIKISNQGTDTLYLFDAKMKHVIKENDRSIVEISKASISEVGGKIQLNLNPELTLAEHFVKHIDRALIRGTYKATAIPPGKMRFYELRNVFPDLNKEYQILFQVNAVDILLPVGRVFN